MALLLGAVLGIALGFITGYMHENVHYANPTFSLYLTGGSAFRWGLFWRDSWPFRHLHTTADARVRAAPSASAFAHAPQDVR
jgi:hypothetical protein